LLIHRNMALSSKYSFASSHLKFSKLADVRLVDETYNACCNANLEKK
jgi:hypothetical protein